MWKITVSAEEFDELPPKAAELLACFLTISDGSMIHTNDSTRFYEFIRHCHAKRVRLTEETFNSILFRVGCPSKVSNKLAGIYGHGRNLLKVRCPT